MWVIGRTSYIRWDVCSIYRWWRCLLYIYMMTMSALYIDDDDVYSIYRWWRCLLYSTKTVRLMIVIWWRYLLYGTKTVRLMIVIWWQTTQWPNDTKGIIRSRKSNDKQHNDQKKSDKRTSNDLQNTTQKTKNWATQTTLETGSGVCRLKYTIVSMKKVVIKTSSFNYRTTYEEINT